MMLIQLLLDPLLRLVLGRCRLQGAQLRLQGLSFGACLRKPDHVWAPSGMILAIANWALQLLKLVKHGLPGVAVGGLQNPGRESLVERGGLVLPHLSVLVD